MLKKLRYLCVLAYKLQVHSGRLSKLLPFPPCLAIHTTEQATCFARLPLLPYLCHALHSALPTPTLPPPALSLQALHSILQPISHHSPNKHKYAYNIIHLRYSVPQEHQNTLGQHTFVLFLGT